MEFLFQAWDLRDTPPWFLHCREITTSSDAARCIPSPRTSPTDHWGGPPSWGNPCHFKSCHVMSCHVTCSHYLEQCSVEVKYLCVHTLWQLQFTITVPETDVSHFKCFFSTSMGTSWLWPWLGLWHLMTLWNGCSQHCVILSYVLIITIVSFLLFNSCSERCDLNTSPSLFYPSGFVLNGRNTIFVENCKLNRYWIIMEKCFF